MEATERRETQDSSRDEQFRVRAEYVVSQYLQEHPDSRLRARVGDGRLSLDDAHEIMREANTDEKTGLANAKFLKYIMAYELVQSRELDQPVSLVIFDIDEFKRINEELGHTGADSVLHDVAGLLQRSIRTSDEVMPRQPDELLSRWGGEEFVVVLPGADVEQARLVAERIRQKIADELADRRPNQRPVTITAGLAEYDPLRHGVDAQKSWTAFLAEADQAMMSGKNVKKNNVYPPPQTSPEVK